MPTTGSTMTSSGCKVQLHPVTTTTLIRGVIPSGLSLPIRSAKDSGNPIKLEPEKEGGRGRTPWTNPVMNIVCPREAEAWGTWLDSTAILSVAIPANTRKTAHRQRAVRLDQEGPKGSNPITPRKLFDLHTQSGSQGNSRTRPPPLVFSALHEYTGLKDFFVSCLVAAALLASEPTHAPPGPPSGPGRDHPDPA
jgi:hypothetical protein